MKNNDHNLIVRKSNDLIQKSRFSLSLQQQKILLYIIGHIEPSDTDFHEYTFAIKDFCQACDIDPQCGTLYKEIKKIIKDIADKSLWITLEDGRETLVRWIEKATIEKGIVKVRLDDDMKPFLLHLTKNYTYYELVWTLHFKSKYSIRLYELIKSIHYDEFKPYTRVYKLDELRKLLDAEVYPIFYDFKVRALEPAIDEINKLADKKIEYRAIKSGKKVAYIEITVSSITNSLERFNRYADLVKPKEKRKKDDTSFI